MNRNFENSIAKLDLDTLDSEELLRIDGGVKAQVDEEGNVIGDCLGHYVKVGDHEIWVPWGTVVFPIAH